jgi:putative transposase
VRFLFIRTEKANYPLTVLCRVLKVSRSGYYAFEKRGPSARESSDRELTVQIQEVHQKSRQTYGSPRVHQELCLSRHQQVGRKRVARLMQSAGIAGQQRRKFCRTTDSRHGLPVAANLLNCQFEMTQPWFSQLVANLSDDQFAMTSRVNVHRSPSCHIAHVSKASSNLTPLQPEIWPVSR